MTTPQVSVVIGVYNGAHEIRATLDSVLSQVDVALEVIVVDDGSTDETADVIASYAAHDPRVVLVRQPHAGLTVALANGCDKARGLAIARADAGDTLLPGRLVRQYRWLETNPGGVLVACTTRHVGLFGETIAETHVSTGELHTGLQATTLDTLRGPSAHGSVMFRIDAYRKAGGYRPVFRVAQDIDLWLRLAELGDVGSLDEALYVGRLSPSGISALRRNEQFEFAKLALAARAARRAGCDDAPVLARAEDIPRTEARAAGWFRSRWKNAAYLYFLGRCQPPQNRELAARYFRMGVRRCPWHLRSWVAAIWTAARA